MKIVAKTDIGLKRDSNQDSYAAGELQSNVAWAVVCDGMGGAAGGNTASSTAVSIISERITTQYREGMTAASIKNMLTSAIAAANISVYDLSKNDAELSGMGTTVVVTIVDGNTVYIAHAGDSRAYVLSKGSLNQLTKDHSIVQEMVDHGTLTPDEAKLDPRKNIITRALGVDYELKVDFDIITIENDDVLILCTDGLTNFVEPDEFYELTEDGKYCEYAERLVKRANDNGGGDNITIVTLSHLSEVEEL